MLNFIIDAQGVKNSELGVLELGHNVPTVCHTNGFCEGGH